jgi:uncharacterized Zn-binding protein involved in type VI secretion
VSEPEPGDTPTDAADADGSSVPIDTTYGESKGEAEFKGSGKVEHKAWEKESQTKQETKKKWVAGDRVPDPTKPAEPKSKTSSEIGFEPILSAQAKGGVLKLGEGKTFATLLAGSASVSALGAALDVKEKKAKLTLVEAKLEGTVAHGQVDLVDMVKKLFGFDEAPKPPPVTYAPMAARFMDLTTHGTPLAPGPGSTNVFIGSMPAWRTALDVCACAAPGAAPHGAGPSAVGEPTVFINSMPAIRVGDWVNEPTGGPNVIVMGCPTVFIGTPAGPPPAFKPPEDPNDLPWIIFESVASADVGAVSAEAVAEAEVDLKQRKGKVEGKIGGMVAAAKATLPLKARILIPFTSAYLGLGVTATGSVGALGGEASGSVKINDGKKLFESSWGAGASFGAGASVKFSLDVAGK